jgi:hypothetical protein
VSVGLARIRCAESASCARLYYDYTIAQDCVRTTSDARANLTSAWISSLKQAPHSQRAFVPRRQDTCTVVLFLSRCAGMVQEAAWTISFWCAFINCLPIKKYYLPINKNYDLGLTKN